jgi:hypothetical protein
MKLRIAIFAVLMAGSSLLQAQTQTDSKPPTANSEPTCGLQRSDLQDELKELQVYAARMQSRIVMMRNSAGVIENSQLRNALQVNADMWQDELDHLRLHLKRMQASIDRCEARQKIRENAR